MKKLQLTKENFEKLLSCAKYQFIFKTGKDVFFLNVGKEVHYSDTSVVAHNETKNKIEIVDFSDIKSGTVDGEKYEFTH